MQLKQIVEHYLKENSNWERKLKILLEKLKKFKEYLDQEESFKNLISLYGEEPVLLTFLNDLLKKNSQSAITAKINPYIYQFEQTNLRLSSIETFHSQPMIIGFKNGTNMVFSIQVDGLKIQTGFTFITCFLMIPKIIYTFNMDYPDQLKTFYYFLENYLDFGIKNKNTAINKFLIKLTKN